MKIPSGRGRILGIILTLAVVLTAALVAMPAAAAPPAPGGNLTQQTPGPAEFEGDPQIAHNFPTGYYIWRNDDGFHLRTHGPAARHLFEARIHTDGVFTDVTPVRNESIDDFKVIDDGRTILLRFRTLDATDGLNFKIQGGTYARFSLYLDSKVCPSGQIYLGAGKVHPHANPFTLRLHSSVTVPDEALIVEESGI